MTETPPNRFSRVFCAASAIAKPADAEAGQQGVGVVAPIRERFENGGQEDDDLDDAAETAE